MPLSTLRQSTVESTKVMGKGSETTVIVTLLGSVTNGPIWQQEELENLFTKENDTGLTKETNIFFSSENKSTGLRIDRVYNYYVLSRSL